jgi:hypothetical protein
LIQMSTDCYMADLMRETWVTEEVASGVLQSNMSPSQDAVIQVVKRKQSRTVLDVPYLSLRNCRFFVSHDKKYRSTTTSPNLSPR